MGANFWTIVLSTSVIMLFAEFADKTNLVALSLMSKTRRPLTIAFGGTLGIAFTSLIGILFGSFLEQLLPLEIVPLFSGLLFLLLGVFGVLELKKGESNNKIIHQEELVSEDINSNTTIRNAFTRSFSLIALAEFGDKSQIFVISGSIIEDPMAIFLGAIIGMGIIMYLSAFIGVNLINRFSEVKLHQIAAISFLIVGSWLIISGLWSFV
ncbi:MAG: TMEM165/GDT1 family protein [Candidatus Kariarchaeaceae archaeon]|jgi:putative Ca2+/H+ antiporter (TMEM165/GDT1 family)